MKTPQVVQVLSGAWVIIAALAGTGCDTHAEAARLPGERVGFEVDDRVINRAVRAALAADLDHRLERVSVLTSRGEVELSGVLDSHAQIDRSLSVAFRVPGVSSVVNHLQLAPKP